MGHDPLNFKKHYFNPRIAADVGINAAIVFEHIAYWVGRNRRAGKNAYDGAFWMYATQKEIADYFDYLTPKQVRTALNRLTSAGYLAIGNYNKTAYDRTAWYRLADKGEPYGLLEDFKPPLKVVPNAPQGAAIPDISKHNPKDIITRADALRKRLASRP